MVSKNKYPEQKIQCNLFADRSVYRGAQGVRSPGPPGGVRGDRSPRRSPGYLHARDVQDASTRHHPGDEE